MIQSICFDSASVLIVVLVNIFILSTAFIINIKKHSLYAETGGENGNLVEGFGYGPAVENKFEEKIDNEANTTAKMRSTGYRLKFNKKRALENSKNHGSLLDPLIENESSGSAPYAPHAEKSKLEEEYFRIQMMTNFGNNSAIGGNSFNMDESQVRGFG
jgi:hypothetical protein